MFESLQKKDIKRETKMGNKIRFSFPYTLIVSRGNSVFGKQKSFVSRIVSRIVSELEPYWIRSNGIGKQKKQNSL